MDNPKGTERFNFLAIQGMEYAVKGILIILILTILTTMGWMVLKSIVELKGLMQGSNIHDISKVVIVNVLMILAILEVFRTVLIYFAEGRVKVTFIIDTALVVVLTEVMAFWFKDIEYHKLIMVIGLVFTLIIARIVAIRFSPTKIDLT